MNLSDELRHIRLGANEGEKPSEMGTVRFMVKCQEGGADIVLTRVKEVLDLALSNSENGVITEVDANKTLPKWLLANFARERTTEENEKWLNWWDSLNCEQKQKEMRKENYSISSWLYWLNSQNRQWFWWDAALVDSQTIYLAVQVREWPFPWSDLRWLFLSAGAASFKAEE